MIVITNPSSITGEIEIIHSLFEEGLELLHIRKPDFSELEMAQFILQIKPEYRDKLVLHSHNELATYSGINRIHFSENNRKTNTVEAIQNKIFSTSTHTIEDFNMLENCFEYAFLSPVFDSISKENYSAEKDLFEAIKRRTNVKTKLVALGGIDQKNIRYTLENGFDNVALLGSVWNSNEPLKNFKLCQKIALSPLA